MLEGFEPSSTLACFLHPMHPAALRIALDLLSPQQALVALLAPGEPLAAWLMCEDFTPDLAEHRLFFATTPDELERLLLTYPGLPTPGQFIRTVAIDDDTCRQLVDACQAAFSRVHEARTALLNQLLQPRPAHRRPPARIVVSAARRFQLWDDAAETLSRLAQSLPDLNTLPWPHDDPLHTAPLALARLAADADAVLLADLVRSDLAGQLASDCPLVTLATSPRVPAYPGNRLDLVLLTGSRQPADWHRAGWPDSRIVLAELPPLPVPPSPSGTPVVGLLADTLPLRIPPAIEEFSSHRLLWERAAAEIAADPAIVAEDALAYLERLRHEMGVDHTHFPLETFVRQLVIPAWQQSVARHLLAAGIPLHLHGRGWDRLGDAAADLLPHWRGPIRSQNDLLAAATPLSALVRPLPLPGDTPARRLGRPLLTVRGPRHTWLKPAPNPAHRPYLTPELLHQCLSRIISP